jgi:ABC-type cobalt transport system substrate-binding protein
MQRHASLFQGVFTHKERRAIASFVQAPQDYFDSEPTFKQSYAPQSGEIFGILKQMKETFESLVLSSMTAEESASLIKDITRKN